MAITYKQASSPSTTPQKKPKTSKAKAPKTKTFVDKKYKVPPKVPGTTTIMEIEHGGGGHHKLKYIMSKLPGVKPIDVLPDGTCVYSQEQLGKVKSSLPELDTSNEDGNSAAILNREKQTSQVELLLLKGVIHQGLITSLLGIDKETTRRLIKAVHLRWEMTGGPRNAARIKGEAAHKLALLEDEYWSLYQDKKTGVGSKINILSNLLQVIDRKLLVHGLSPRVLESIAVDAVPEGDVTKPNLIESSVSIQESLAQATREALQLIADAAGASGVTIEH